MTIQIRRWFRRSSLASEERQESAQSEKGWSLIFNFKAIVFLLDSVEELWFFVPWFPCEHRVWRIRNGSFIMITHTPGVKRRPRRQGRLARQIHPHGHAVRTTSRSRLVVLTVSYLNPSLMSTQKLINLQRWLTRQSHVGRTMRFSTARGHIYLIFRVLPSSRSHSGNSKKNNNRFLIFGI